jgi:hypothetical protein
MSLLSTSPRLSGAKTVRGKSSTLLSANLTLSRGRLLRCR